MYTLSVEPRWRSQTRRWEDCSPRRRPVVALSLACSLLLAHSNSSPGRGVLVHRLGCQADCGIELDVQQVVVVITVRSYESLPGSWQQIKELIGLLNGLSRVLNALCRRKRDRQAGDVPE
eukprot:1179864-Prorocentrum_minimum.AAC.5